jgi:formate hydrogenlyase subunit 3/multisubunit Na+/H+ antiporter MnhD subunit
MTIVDMGLALVTGGALAGALAIILLPRRVRPLVSGLVTAGVGVGGVLAGVGGLSGAGWTRVAPGLLPLGEARLSVDALSGVFLLLVGGVAIAAGIYGIGYTTDVAHHENPAGSRTTQATVPLFVASMLFVPAAGSVTTLLVVWELMALTSLVLVLTEHRLRASVRDAGLWYGGMTHAGLVAIMTGLVIFAARAGGETFEALRAGAAGLSPAVRSTVFVLVLIGFGAKAGLVPLHVWLPRAHPEAPSHVSALMSAAMVALGIYGVVRVVFDLLGGGPRWWGLLVLALGAISALFGVLQASVATDLKRLLAYSTTENVGLMAIGIGAAGVFAADGNHALAGVLMAAALLHALNHAAFKTVLFLGAGSVLRATGLRDLDALGGLVRRMPVTTALFGIGALGAAALPPGNGFVSEWVLLQGLIHSVSAGVASSPVVAVSIPVAVGVVALTAGLGVATFVKAFGVGFLAQPRSTAAATAIESPMPMRVGMGVAAASCAVLALAPALVGGSLDRVLNVVPALRDTAPLADSAVTLRLAGIQGSMSPLLITLGLVISAVLAAVVVRRLAGSAPRRIVGVWANGGPERNSRQELTATSFAEPLTRVFDDVLRPEHDIDVTPYAESSYLIESVTFRQRVPDRLEAAIYPPVLATLEAWGRWSRRLANGHVHRYLAYGFIGLLTALVAVAVIS